MGDINIIMEISSMWVWCNGGRTKKLGGNVKGKKGDRKLIQTEASIGGGGGQPPLQWKYWGGGANISFCPPPPPPIISATWKINNMKCKNRFKKHFQAVQNHYILHKNTTTNANCILKFSYFCPPPPPHPKNRSTPLARIQILCYVDWGNWDHSLLSEDKADMLSWSGGITT